MAPFPPAWRAEARLGKSLPPDQRDSLANVTAPRSWVGELPNPPRKMAAKLSQGLSEGLALLASPPSSLESLAGCQPCCWAGGARADWCCAHSCPSRSCNNRRYGAQTGPRCQCLCSESMVLCQPFPKLGSEKMPLTGVFFWCVFGLGFFFSSGRFTTA